MEEKKNIYEKLSLIQNEMKVGKNNYNKFGKYNYRSAEDILAEAKKICCKHRTTLILTDDIKVAEARYYVVANAILMDWDSHMTVEVTAMAREEEAKKGMDSSQVTGSCSSYARKYALNGLFNLDDTKDADTDEHHKTTNQPAKDSGNKPFKASTSRPASEKQLDYIKTLATQKGVSEEAIKARLKQIATAKDASDAIAKLTGKEQ